MMSTSNPDFYSEQDRPYLERMRAATKLNVYGGSCMAYAQIATGRIDIGFDVAFDIHDYLPLVPVIEGAGGIVTDWQGNRLTKSSGDRLVACGDKRLHEQAIKIFSS
jgi:fructose-1,6-bisphosphatase/inositol monophosphatase family enzyme